MKRSPIIKADPDEIVVIEFGPGEYLDTFIVRPFAMWFFPYIIGSLAIGIFLGKIVADIIFYIPTIIMYEIRKKNFDD